MSLLLVLLTTFSIQANTDCFDRGLRATGQLEESYKACGITLSSIPKMRDRLTAGPVMYVRRAFKALRQLDAEIEGVERNECNDSVRSQYRTEYREDIVRAIDLCSL